MPLSDVGRRYADKLYQNSQEEILKAQRDKLVAVRTDHAKRNMTMSGSYIAAHGNVLVEQIRLLGEARTDSLVKAYEKSGLPFDDAAMHEIKDEVIQFCHQQQHSAVATVGQVIRQTFGAQSSPPELDTAIGQEIVAGVTSVMSRIARDLSIRRDEGILAALSSPIVEDAGELDDLVPLYSKRQFDTDVSTLCKDGARSGSVSILFADLDHFKQVNDIYGHLVGNKVLIGVAAAMKAACAGKGRVYRWGGKELAALLPNYTSHEAIALAERIRSTVADLDVEGCSSKITVSIGVASHPEAGGNVEELIAHADKAMYAAKESGRNRVGCAGGNGGGTIAKGSEDQRLSEKEVKKRVERVKLWIRLERGKANNFIVYVENKSAEEVVIEEIRVESDGYPLTEPAYPPGPDIWKVLPNCTFPLSWCCQTDPVATLTRLHDYRGVFFRTEVQIVLECRILGQLREFGQKIPVNVNASAQEIVSLLKGH
jgi:diguanylate cyclase (GGDEF)-like protein